MKRTASVQKQEIRMCLETNSSCVMQVWFHYLRIIREALCFLAIKHTEEMTRKVILIKLYNLNKTPF